MTNMKAEKNHTHISSDHKLFDFKIKEFFRYKDLVLILARKDFNQRYRQTVLGPIWAFINPLLTGLMHLFIFSSIAKIGTGGIPEILFYLFSDNLWLLFSSSLSDCSYTFIANSYLFSKVYFPRLTVPAARLLVILYRWGIRTLVSLPFYIYYIVSGAVTPKVSALILVPVILLWVSLLGFGIGLLVGSATTKYRDLSMLIGFFLQLWMYATPVVYPLSELREMKWYAVSLCNPMTALMELFRYAVFGKGEIHPFSLVFSAAVTVIVLFLGLIAFHRVEKDFVDTV